MADRLPPLTALRAFEAAARHMSFAQAAAELHVTPAALSFQIKSLESHLGAPLFIRLNRAVALTEEGRALYPAVSDGFDALQRGWRNVTARLASPTLVVTAGPGFTAKWLAPRLFKFAQAHPEIELRFSATLKLLDFDRDDVDIAIRFGQGEDDDARHYSRTIIREWATPMVAPQFADDIKTPADLAKTKLLHQEDTAFLKPPSNWPAWFELNGLPQISDPGTRFSQADHAVDAALAGAGAILGRVSLTEQYLRDGRLVMPFREALDMNATYRLVCPKGSETRPQVAQFIDWVVSETSELDKYADGLNWLARP